MGTYLKFALYSSDGLKKGIYQKFPELLREAPCWEVLYSEKKSLYEELLETRGAPLMPGVEKLLLLLEERGSKRCVVTHSTKDQTALLRKRHPILTRFPNWITREEYALPKPSSECYELAIKRFADKGDRVIGFEDSPRGLRALLGTQADGMLVSGVFSEREVGSLSEQIKKKFSHISSFNVLTY